MALLNSLDGFSGLRAALSEIGRSEGSWAGIPMPIQGYRLTIEPNFPRAKALAIVGETDEMRERAAKDIADAEGWTLRNIFWSFRFKRRVAIYQNPDGKIEWFWHHGANPMDRILSVMDISSAWGIEQEARAIKTLGSLLRHHQFKAYMLTGSFMERSTRSGLVYVFRKLRPTVILDTTGSKIQIRCTMCLHPIGYYEDTWAGAMCPTDDVIAHLMLMRGDEPMFWRRANQHASWLPESGIHL